MIIATGIRPNVEFLQGSGIDCDQGVLVDAHMRTNCADIYAAGDMAQGPVLFSSEREIHSIQPTAVDHGRVAGANMASQDIAYPGSLSMNVLDVCGLQCASFGNWSNNSDEAMKMANYSGPVYRSLLWTEDEITGAIFVGRANDEGMLTDVGMVKGILQTRTKMGTWKNYLKENPFDIRRPFIANRVPEILTKTTLLGSASRPRQFRFGSAAPIRAANLSHQVYCNTKPS